MSQPTSETGAMSSLQSQHHEALTELRRYKLLVESVQDYAIFFMDKDGYIQTWNKGAERNKGYKAEEIIGKHFSNFYLPYDVADKKPERELAIARKLGRAEDEDWRVRKDGTRFWANVVITSLYDESGELVGFAKVTRNLTDRKRQEDDLRNANSKLRLQQEELKSLNSSKDEFISLASHQLRTPATAIKQLLGLMMEGFAGDISSSLLPIIQKAYESNERQIGIINSLLKVAQIDAGKVVLRKELVDMNRLVRDVIDEQSDTIAKRRQTISFEPIAASGMVYADAQYLRMALENIVDNASKYTFDEGIIEVGTSKKGKYMKISIRDNGVGIGDDDLVTLFEKFKRIPNNLSQKVAGSGLGLYWVKKVVELHGGYVDVKSVLGQGTTFNIYIPREPLDA